MYSTETLASALKAVKSGMSKRMVSKTYNVPRGTIQFRLRRQNVKDLPGPSSVLCKEEEDSLVEWLLESNRKGFPNKRIDLILSVANIIKQTDRKNPFKNGIPGKTWYHLFVQRHPELGNTMSEAMKARSCPTTEDDVKSWFTQIETFLLENNNIDILEDPSRVFNVDELSLQLCPKSGEIIANKASKSEKDVGEIGHMSSKSSVSVIVTFGANGDITPPLVVFPNKILTNDPSQDSCESSTSVTDVRWMKAEQFYDYIQNVFHPYLLQTQRQFPVILFVDSSKTPHTLDISELCKSLDIILISLYPNATKFLEPADAINFRPLKRAWKSVAIKWKRDHPLQALTKKNFVPILKEVLENGVQISSVVDGFRATGLFPWNSDAINYKKCLGKLLEEVNTKDDDFPTDTIVLQVTGDDEDDIWNKLTREEKLATFCEYYKQ